MRRLLVWVRSRWAARHAWCPECGRPALVDGFCSVEHADTYADRMAY